jgi:hypothetical protein
VNFLNVIFVKFAGDGADPDGDRHEKAPVPRKRNNTSKKPLKCLKKKNYS